jgi:hypothetical protein
MNAIRPNADQHTENKSVSLDSRTPATGPNGADCGEAWQIYHAGFRPACRMRPEMWWRENPEKKDPALSRRAAEVMARSRSERSRNRAMLQTYRLPGTLGDTGKH